MGCPVPMADTELRNAAKEFFERTRAWREWLDPITAEDGIRQYDLSPPTGSIVFRLEAGTKNGSEIAIDGAYSLSKDPLTYTNTSNSLVSSDRQTVILLSDPVEGDVIHLQASLVPSDDATGIPDHLAPHFAEAIVAGALYRIRTLEGQPFTNVNSAAVDLAKFEGHVSRVHAEVFRTHTNTTPRRRPTWC